MCLWFPSYSTTCFVVFIKTSANIDIAVANRMVNHQYLKDPAASLNQVSCSFKFASE